MSNTQEAAEFDQLCQEYVNALYQNVTGFVTYEPGEKEAAVEKKIFMTYGEILYPGVNRLIDYMEINENDVLYDMGSGVGKVALQYFLKSPLKKAVGIEAHQGRHTSALQVYDQVKKEFPELFAGGRILDSVSQNFLEADISDATILFVASTCYSEDLLADIGKLADAKCPKLKYIASHKPIPNKLPLVSIVDIECSWDTAKSHFYGHLKEGMPAVGMDKDSAENPSS